MYRWIDEWTLWIDNSEPSQIGRWQNLSTHTVNLETLTIQMASRFVTPATTTATITTPTTATTPTWPTTTMTTAIAITKNHTCRRFNLKKILTALVCVLCCSLHSHVTSQNWRIWKKNHTFFFYLSKTHLTLPHLTSAHTTTNEFKGTTTKATTAKGTTKP